jgi:hypothetical protein
MEGVLILLLIIDDALRSLSYRRKKTAYLSDAM